MSDARWVDIDEDVAAASRHFASAVALHAAGGFDEDGLAGYRNGMALMHALQSAHTSAEMALTRLLAMMGEERPIGEDWHQKLISRAAKAIEGQGSRPAILSPEVADDLDETRRFRNRATRSYGAFDVSRIGPTIEAAGRLAASLALDFASFKASIDPDTKG
ncbi:hypothetical protein RHAL1_00557 [Beijerinckiaceae bacterium RH AL1]|nr:hypothetical protein [Beijerinckiaceae bacterium]VVB43114.1 hypothetical protein RHAL8_00529 [Beijerinckiaceae bacterium RH AL8]VVB43129.1 hypothetical protein RHCH11_RHCH11_00531 [Beijerinckiaceae bacterium RH CH11]VVC53675.1 hypothetical protein RHAL1_00557 [Beijerinckiaceae bacterium RH AL1]